MKNWKLQLGIVVFFLPSFASAQAPTPADALALEQQGKLAEAAQVWQAVTRHDPHDAAAFASLGEFKQGHFQAAIDPLRSTLDADPANLQARMLLGLSCYGGKRYAEAVKYLKPIAESDAANVELHRVLAQSCLFTKEYTCALDEFRQILQK